MICPECGERNNDDARMCGMCGKILKSFQAPSSATTHQVPVVRQDAVVRPATLPPPPRPNRPPPARTGNYILQSSSAGLFQRWLAAFIDNILVVIFAAIIAAFTYPLILNDLQSDIAKEIYANIVILLVSWTYFAGMESSSRQATIGKGIMHIMVCDTDGFPISFGRATGRFLAKTFLSPILLVGYIMVFFMPRHQALHDLIANTVVEEA